MKAANTFRWRTALKIAWREAHLSSARFGFVILAVAVGVGSLAGVRGFSREFRHMRDMNDGSRRRARPTGQKAEIGGAGQQQRVAMPGA